MRRRINSADQHVILRLTARLVLLLLVGSLVKLTFNGKAQADLKLAADSTLLSKKLLYQASQLGSISDISVRELANGAREIAVAGGRGVAYLDKKFKVTREVAITGAARQRNLLIDVNHDGLFEIINRGGDGWQETGLFDSNGELRWQFGRDLTGVDDMCPADFDHDGNYQFVVGLNGGGGLRLLDDKGRERWQQPGSNIWHIEIVDTNNDGKPEIVHTSNDEIVIRDKTGKLLNRFMPMEGEGAAFFTTCRWPTLADANYLIAYRDKFNWIFDFTGRTIAKLPAPQSEAIGHLAAAATVRFAPSAPDYFAVLVQEFNVEKTMLYLYRPDGTLAYQELLPERCQVIKVVNNGNTGRQLLWIGGEGKIWQYRP